MSFTDYFKLDHQPFCEKIPTQQIIADERIKQALARLQYLAQSGLAALITGQTGVGKSTLIKLFLDALPKNQFLPIYLHFTHVKSFGLFYLLLNELGEEPKRTKDRVFLQLMEKTRKLALTPIIIIDEAHLLNQDAITDLRLLISSPLDETPAIKLILCGQMEIKNQLKKSIHADFANRISVYFHLAPLTLSQTHAYIDLQMKRAGNGSSVFDTQVKDAIFDFSAGIPRIINNIATACLIHAAVEEKRSVDFSLFNRTMADFQLF
jgi:general secretion pathway protein A